MFTTGTSQPELMLHALSYSNSCQSSYQKSKKLGHPEECGFWRTAVVILHIYSFISKSSVALPLKNSLTQWHSPVKENTLQQKWVSSTSKARLFHTSGTKVFYLFFHLKLGISYFFFQSLYFLCQSLFNDKTDRIGQWKHKNATKMDATNSSL